MSENLYRTLLCGGVALLVVFGTILTMPRLHFVARGIFLPAVNAPQGIHPNTQGVKIVEAGALLPPFEPLGWVSVQYHTIAADWATEHTVLRKVRALVADAGGHLVLVTVGGHTLSSTPKPLASQVLQGYVYREQEWN